MSNFLSNAKKCQNLDSTFKLSPFQSHSFGVQQKSEEFAPASKAELWENYQQAKQLNHKGANVAASALPIQAKLTIGQPGDKYEQEADSVADRVMSMPEPTLAKSTVTNSVQTRSIQPIQKLSTDSPENTTEELKQEGAEDQLQAKEAISQTPKITTTSAKVAAIPNEPSIQRDSPSNLPPIPNYQLTMPSLGQEQDPSSRYNLGGDLSLHLDPQFQSTMQQVQEQVTPTTIRTALGQIKLNVPSGTPASAANPLAMPSQPTPTASSPVPAGDGPDQTRAADAGDLMDAILAIPSIETAIDSLKTQASDRITQDWQRLNTGEKVLGVSSLVVVGGGLLAGVIANPAARKLALDQLNGKVLPVPKLNWLHLEINTGGENLMLGLHVDVGQLLPSSWGFKASSPDAIGGPPEPEPFSLQRKSDSIENAPSSSSLEDRLNGSKGGGNPLSDEVRSFMEPRFGADFSGVRVHTGSDAVQMNQEVNAQAFAHGSDVYFGAGKAPGKDALTAHELTHVVQQTGGVQRQIKKIPQLESTAISSVTKSEGHFIHRDTPDTSNSQPSVNTKYYFDIAEEKVAEKGLSYGKVSSSIKAKGSIELMQVNNGGQGIEAPVTQGVSKTLKGAGYKTERVLGKQHVSGSIRDWTFDGDLKEKFITEIGTEKVDISIGLEARAKCLKIPELKAAGDLKGIIAATSLKEVNKTKLLALEGGLGLEGEGTIELPNIGLAKIKTTGQIVGTLEPDWEKIIAKATEIALRKGAELLAMDSGAVASAAAGIAFPLGATALMVAGGMQTEKNISASRAAIAMGVKMRREAKDYAHAYVNTLTGGNGSGQGSIDANVKVMEYMTATGKSREDACVDFSEKNGGSGNMYNEIITSFREQVFEKSVAEFEQKFADRFGVLEKLGSEWGMRGVFRKDFRRLLYDTW